jgi:hypothetical protein
MILKYSLQSFEKDIEGTIQIGKRARKLAALPSLKPESKQTSTAHTRARKSRQRTRS